jgi:hypothetical protein
MRYPRSKASPADRVLWVLDATAGCWVPQARIIKDGRMAPGTAQAALRTLLLEGVIYRGRLALTRQGRPAWVYRRRVTQPQRTEAA